MTYGPADFSAMQAELRRDDTTVDIKTGTQYLLKSSLEVGEGTVLNGNGVKFVAPENVCRINVNKPNVEIHGINGSGYFTIYFYEDNFWLDNSTIAHSLDGKTHLDHGAKSSATGAVMGWLDVRSTGRNKKKMEKIRVTNVTVEKSYHHSFNINLLGAQEGGTFEDVLFENCVALDAGSGYEGDGVRDWSCGFDIPDAGNIRKMRVINCQAHNCWQDGFHLDGSWTGHHQDIIDVVFENCVATRAGQRCSPKSKEKFWNGFYMPHALLKNCRTEACRHAGFAFKNEMSHSLVVENCIDVGSTYGMIAEYGCIGAKIQFTSKSAKYRAFQGQVQGYGQGKLDLTVIDPPHMAATFGRTQRVDFIDCPNHDNAIAKYAALGYVIHDGAVTIRTAEPSLGLEVWPKSKMNLGAIVWKQLEAQPIIEVPDETVPPAPLKPYILSEDGCIKPVLPDGTKLMLVGGGFMADDAAGHFPHGSVWRRAE